MNDQVELDQEQATAESEAGVPATPLPRCLDAADVAPSEASSAASQALLGRLLAMAQRYRKERSYRQATELFWTLAEEHPGTPQSDAAKVALQELAEEHERAGAQRMARSMYERLLDLEG